ALALLAAGDPAAAAAAVHALEAPLLTGPGRAAGEDLAEIVVETVRQLAAEHPAIVEPVFLLHRRLYRDAATARDYLLMNQARQTALQIADLHAGLHKTPEGRARTARLVLALAADLLKTAPTGMRERTYLRILDLDPDNLDALLCRAVDLERQGRYQDALESLLRLVRVHPEHGEGRLRLAIDRLRLGQAREGKRLLEELIRTPPEKIETTGLAAVVLATQELVRLLLDDGELADAERTARAGLARFPDDEKLRFQLALLQDLRHDARGARETLQPLEQRARPAGPETARHRFNALPLERLERLRDEMEAGGAAALADLAAALQGESP
ncbi:MAG TPA: hypothetical protein DD490_21770, partial [Acidobacteria bacterium]|nr:hypothetical protein [Acidobacteriota bacterium]